MTIEASRLQGIGAALLRYSLVFFFLAFGAYKFTETEALGIQPLVAHSLAMSWLYHLAGVRGVSNLIGVIEIATGVLIALRRWAPRLSAIGSLAAAFALLNTLSFLFTTPGLAPDMQGFLMKDLTLLAAALWTAGEALGQAPRVMARFA